MVLLGFGLFNSGALSSSPFFYVCLCIRPLLFFCGESCMVCFLLFVLAQQVVLFQFSIFVSMIFVICYLLFVLRSFEFQ